MLLQRGGKDNDVTEVKEQGLSLLQTKHPLHVPLEGAWGIAQPIGHSIELQKAKRSAKGCFGFVLFRHPDLVVTTGQIDCRKPASPRECIQALLDAWQRKCILSGLAIEKVAIYT